MNKRIVEMAIECAEQSTYKFRLGAIITHRGRVIGSGWNKPNKTHPKSPSPYYRICAEFDAIMEAMYDGWTERLLSECSIYIHRLKKDGSPGLAKPCTWCQQLLDKIGIMDIQYSKG